MSSADAIDSDEVMSIRVESRRLDYEEEVRREPINYKAWFGYLELEQSFGNNNSVRIRDVYQRSVSNLPPVDEKWAWRRYIYLWMNYAFFEELVANDIARTRRVYCDCLRLIPHKKFSFASIWVLAAQFEARQLNLDRARQILDNAIRIAPKHKIFKKYIDFELQLGNIDRCRKLYEKFLDWSPENCYAWIKYAELEKSLSETARARAIFELAITQPALDMPELLWEVYTYFEIAKGEFERTRQFYERLLDRTKHVKVWINYAKFEASAMEEDLQGEDLPENDIEELVCKRKKKCLERARGVFERALTYFRTYAPELKEDWAMLLKEWLNMESSSFGELGDVNFVRGKLLLLKKRMRHIETDKSAANHLQMN